MITQKEEERIQLLSDTKLYPQAVEFMRGIAKRLPSSQINGLLNVSLGENSYQELTDFVDAQYKRTTWRASEQHIPEFYRRLKQKFNDLERAALDILALRRETAIDAEGQDRDRELMKMAIAREFIQHLLAENDYMIGTQAFQSGDANREPRNDQQRPDNNQRGPWPTKEGRR